MIPHEINEEHTACNTLAKYIMNNSLNILSNEEEMIKMKKFAKEFHIKDRGSGLLNEILKFLEKKVLYIESEFML